MKIAYLDCFAGISGDMILGALLDAGVDAAAFRAELEKLDGVEFELKISKVVKRGIEATNVDVLTREHHHHRRLRDITELISSSALSDTVKARAIDTFRRLADAEGSVHGTGPEEVHFHEVGAVDAIVDIIGAAIGIDLLGIEQVIVSPLPMGHGFVEAAHGKIPLPAPATVELLKGAPVYSVDIEGEMVTPTGAAIARTLAASFGRIPTMVVESTGYGAGKTDFPFPNVLRILVGESSQEAAVPPSHRVSIVETNIDDMNPEFYDSVFDKLFSAGVVDVFLTPISMKKSRPATLLSAICPTESVDEVAQVILSETTSFGVRIIDAHRRCLDRKWEEVTTSFGRVRIKLGLLGDTLVTASPEYEDCRQAAEAHGVPVRRVYDEAIARFREKDGRG